MCGGLSEAMAANDAPHKEAQGRSGAMEGVILGVSLQDHILNDEISVRTKPTKLEKSKNK